MWGKDIFLFWTTRPAVRGVKADVALALAGREEEGQLDDGAGRAADWAECGEKCICAVRKSTSLVSLQCIPVRKIRMNVMVGSWPPHLFRWCE